MFKLCICDDQEKELLELHRLAKIFSKDHPEVPIQISVFQSTHDLLDYIREFGGFDLYLLDIIMPDLNGIELATHIRERKEKAEILFLTISREYALEAFSVKASNYLVKPIQKNDFDRAVSTCINNLLPKSNPCILIKSKEGIRKVCVHNLMVIESFNHSRICSLADGTTIETSMTLSSLYEELSSYACFYMPHRAYIVHLDYVNGLTTTELLLNNGQRVPVSRKAYADLKRTLLDYSIQRNTLQN